NRPLRLARRPFEVGVLDPQDECRALTACEQPVEQRRARVANVQLSGGTRRKADAHGGISAHRLTSATACTAMESPVPIESTPSFVFPLTLTCEASHASAEARFCRMASMCGTSFGRWAMTTTSTFTTE